MSVQDVVSDLSTPEKLEELNALLSGQTIAERLAFVSQLGRCVLTTSLGIEDQVLTADIATNKLNIRLATLKTGRLFAQTLDVLKATEDQYGVEIEYYEPEEKAVSSYVKEYGLNGFYESVEARHACCNIRKMEPLKHALSNAEIWITGLRRGQSNNRGQIPFIEYDEGRHILKVNPLADVSIEDIRAKVTAENIPINALHDRGFPSIGCEPCTRAIKPGEDERAGRWWWERDAKRECGLHVAAAS